MKSSMVGKFFLVTVLTLFSSMVSAQNLVVNGSFEEPDIDEVTNNVGYIQDQADLSITAWTITPAARGHGLNDATTKTPFHGGGRPVPDGDQVLFIQGADTTTLAQVIEGLEEDNYYLLIFYTAIRPGNAGMNVSARIGDLELMEVTSIPENGTAPYHQYTIPFQYTSETVGATPTLTFTSVWPDGGDVTVLFDNIQIRKPVLSADITGPTLVAQGTDVVLGTDLTEVTGDAEFQWYYNGVTLEGETGATLALLDVVIDDSGVYSVEITDAANSITVAYTLTVVESLPVSNLLVLALFVIVLLLIGTVSLRRVLT
jgi:hypothetical protein